MTQGKAPEGHTGMEFSHFLTDDCCTGIHGHIGLDSILALPLCSIRRRETWHQPHVGRPSPTLQRVCASQVKNLSLR